MKKFLLSLLVIVLALGLLGAAAYAGYQYGYTQGALAASEGSSQALGRWLDMGPDGMRMHEFGMYRGFDRNGFGMLPRGIGFGFFPLFGLLARVLFWGLVIAGLYWLITRSGWRLTKSPPAPTTTTVVESPAPPPAEDKDV